MESSGCTDKIHISNKTAMLLEQAGRKSWISPRNDSVNVKGKGVLSTYWLNVTARRATSIRSGGSHSDSPVFNMAIKESSLQQKERLVDWMTDLFMKHIVKIVGRQDTTKVGKVHPNDLVYRVPANKTSLDEVAEIIKLPKFDHKATARATKRGAVTVPPSVVNQLRDVISRIANMYLENPFHNVSSHTHSSIAKFQFLINLALTHVPLSYQIVRPCLSCDTCR